MAVFIGVDGGGSKTRMLIQSDGGATTYHEFDESIRFLEKGYATAAQKFLDLLRTIELLEISQIRSISIGLAGASLENEQRRMEQAVKSLLEGMVKVQVQGDSTLSLSAAFPQGSGVIVIAGTGSVAIGRNVSGQTIKVGGWGKMLGDEGSGHAIGLAALRHFTRVIDGLEHPGPLYSSINATLADKIESDTRELRTILIQSEVVPAHYAKLVFDHVSDTVAMQIIESASKGLCEIIHSCAKQVDYQGNVRAIGSVICNPIMLEAVNKLLDPFDLVVSPLESDAPVKHALFLARSAGQ